MNNIKLLRYQIMVFRLKLEFKEVNIFKGSMLLLQKNNSYFKKGKTNRVVTFFSPRSHWYPENECADSLAYSFSNIFLSDLPFIPN